jgi:hypothetical protein
MTDKEGKADAQPFHLVLLASDLVGYRNLCRLITDAHIDGYYYKPRIDREHLAKYAEGLIGLSACLNGEVARALQVEDWDLARAVAGEYRDILGPDRFYPTSRITAWSSAGPSSSCGSLPRSACGSSSRTTSTTSIAARRRPTTSCSASGPATTSTRPAASSSKPTPST